MTIGFIIRRVMNAVPTLFGVSLIAFLLIRLIPGDPVLMMLGERGVDPAAVAEVRANLGLDRPLAVQYVDFVRRALAGDLGRSVISQRGVWSEFADRFPATVELSLVSLIWAIALGIPMGVVAAIFRRRWPDFGLMTASLIGYSMPISWWGLVLIMTCSVHFGITPVGGRLSAALDVEPVTGFVLFDVWLRGFGWAGFKDAVHHLALPAFVLGTIPVAAIARMTRSSLLEVLGEDFVRTARAKGVREPRVIFVHALRNALIPVVTVVGLMMGTLLTGAVLTETMFSWPGVGRWLVASVQSRDYPVLQGGTLLLAVVIVVVNTFVDIVYAFLNPRLREGAAE